MPKLSDIKSAYRLEAKKYHPDVAMQSTPSCKAEAESKFQEVREAYETLLRPTMSDAAKKLTTPDVRSYDADLREYQKTAGGGSIRAMTALLLVMTGWLAYDLHRKKRLLPHQRGKQIGDLFSRFRR